MHVQAVLASWVAAAQVATKPFRSRLRGRLAATKAWARSAGEALLAANPLLVAVILSAYFLAISILWAGIVRCWRDILR